MLDQPTPQMDATYPAVQKFLDRHVLQYMHECSGTHFDEFYFYIRFFENDWITHEMARAICRSLTDRGYCVWRRGLFNEDGEVAGSGYGITPKGIAYLETLFT